MEDGVNDFQKVKKMLVERWLKPMETQKIALIKFRPDGESHRLIQSLKERMHPFYVAVIA